MLIYYRQVMSIQRPVYNIILQRYIVQPHVLPVIQIDFGTSQHLSDNAFVLKLRTVSDGHGSMYHDAFKTMVAS